MSNCLDLNITGINDFYGCRVQLRWRNTTDNVRVSIYFPQEPQQRKDHGAIYFQQHFAKHINDVIPAIAKHFQTTPEQVNEWSSYQGGGTKRFSVEVACNNTEANEVRNRNWQNVASISEAVNALGGIAERF